MSAKNKEDKNFKKNYLRTTRAQNDKKSQPALFTRMKFWEIQKSENLIELAQPWNTRNFSHFFF